MELKEGSEGREKAVVLEPVLTGFPPEKSAISTYRTDIKDAVTNEKVGWLAFSLHHGVGTRPRKMIVDDIKIDRQREGYGVATYKSLQSQYPDYELHSGQMNAKTDPTQEKPNAVYLWEKLVSLGLAEKDGSGGFHMKSTK